ncbi:unnamed protein product [Larinioides sclopetarius]|uniref:Uncharacterized protein n=1 Tax=Larinioides sclopetarius TaxID=280406 RepID=A0AAV2BSD4_9ARAC
MASGNKACRLQARKVTQDVLMFVWYKHGVISTEPNPELSFVPEIPAEFLNNLCVLVWIESPRNGNIWGDFLENHFERMTKTPYLFANYFAYATYLSIEAKTVHACFVNILSLVIHFALHCWQETEDKKFLNSCVDLFCEFFDKELCQKFEGLGRWNSFNEYIKKRGSLRSYNEQIRSNKPPNEIFKEFQLSHQESDEPYSINGVVLKDITQDDVENHKKAVSFADFVGDKMKEVCGKAFEQVLKDFSKIDNQVEKLYRETVGVASGGVAITEDQSSLQEVQKGSLENVASRANLTKVEGQKAFKDLPEVDNQEGKLNQETVSLTSSDMASDGGQSSSQEIKEEAIEINTSRNPNKIETRKERSKASDPLETRDSSPQAPKESDQSSKLTDAKVANAKVLLKVMLTDLSKISELIKFLCEE